MKRRCWSLVGTRFGCVTDQPWDVVIRSCLVILDDVCGSWRHVVWRSILRSWRLLNNFREFVVHRRLLGWQMSSVLDVRLHLQHASGIDIWSVGLVRRRLFYGCWWRPGSVVLRITVTKGLPTIFHMTVGWSKMFLLGPACSMIAGDDRRMGVDRARALLNVRLKYGRMGLGGV